MATASETFSLITALLVIVEDSFSFFGYALISKDMVETCTKIIEVSKK